MKAEIKKQPDGTISITLDGPVQEILAILPDLKDMGIDITKIKTNEEEQTFKVTLPPVTYQPLQARCTCNDYNNGWWAVIPPPPCPIHGSWGQPSYTISSVSGNSTNTIHIFDNDKE
jgi:hypothetical protein